MQAVLKFNPFPEAAPNRVLVLFLDEAPPAESLKAVEVPGREEMSLRGRELYLHFPDGMGQSKLEVPMQKVGTGRNLNTVSKVARMLEAMSEKIG
jgi:uncharacterized protein (DUF1697 family)